MKFEELVLSKEYEIDKLHCLDGATRSGSFTLVDTGVEEATLLFSIVQEPVVVFESAGGFKFKAFWNEKTIKPAGWTPKAPETQNASTPKNSGTAPKKMVIGSVYVYDNPSETAFHGRPFLYSGMSSIPGHPNPMHVFIDSAGQTILGRDDEMGFFNLLPGPLPPPPLNGLTIGTTGATNNPAP